MAEKQQSSFPPQTTKFPSFETQGIGNTEEQTTFIDLGVPQAELSA